MHGFYAADNYAATALRTRTQVGYSMADPSVHVAAETFAFHVLPDIGENSLIVVGPDDGTNHLVGGWIAGRRSRLELWAEPNLPMEIHSWIEGMLEHRDVYYQIVFERETTDAVWMLATLAWLAPETILPVGGGTQARYEQYASVRAFEGAGVGVIGKPREWLETFGPEEIFHLRWPLTEPSQTRAPVREARLASRAIDRHAKEMLLNARAMAEPNERFLTLTRARAGAYADALEHEKQASAVAGDRLFLPPDTAVTEYFYIDRLIRSRVAAAAVRSYVIDEFNRQVLRRWTEQNGWPEVRLTTRRTFWAKGDWVSFWEQYQEGVLHASDVVAAADAETERLMFD
jgi:hypothetical protein